MNYCKLTNQNLQTYNGFQWKIGEWKEASGEGELCSKGWLHCYTHPLLAVFLNPVHAQIRNPKLFEIEVAGKIQEDYGIKVGFTKMRLIKEIPLPQVTNTQKIAFGILCAKEVVINKKWQKWADNWLNGTDRTQTSAYVYAAAYAALNASYEYAIYAAAVDAEFSARCKKYVRQGATVINLIELAEKALTYN